MDLADPGPTAAASARGAAADSESAAPPPRPAGFAPTRRALQIFGAGFVFSALPALWAESLWWLWLAFCGVSALCGAVDFARLVPVYRLESCLEVPGRIGVGRIGVGRIGVGSIGVGAAAELRCVLRLPEGTPVRATVDTAPPLKPSSPVAAVAGPDGARLRLELRPERRGIGQVRRLWVRYVGPLGLIERQICFEIGADVEIVPDIEFVHSEALRILGTRHDRAGSKIERFAGDGTEFDALREFVTGDDPRKVDWKASARHTRLLAREMRAERNHQIIVALDSGRLMAEPVAGAPLLDHGIHAGLLLARISLRHGDRVGLYTFADRPGLYSAPRGGAPAFEALRQLTGSIAYSPEESNFTLALTELGLRLRRRSLIIVLTDFVDAVTAELMVENLQRLARRHLLIFVAFRDPLLAAEAGREPTSMLDIERAAVADSLVQERQVVLERLRRSGLTVVDAPPRQVGAQLVNRYLAIKRRERI